jgi:hypothetical protein
MVDQGPPIDAQCPSSAAFLGYAGVTAAVCLSNWGSAVSKSWFRHHHRLFVKANYLVSFFKRWEHGKQGRV